MPPWASPRWRECLRRLRAGQETESLAFLEFVSEGEHVVLRLHVQGRATAMSWTRPEPSSDDDLVVYWSWIRGDVRCLLQHTRSGSHDRRNGSPSSDTNEGSVEWEKTMR